MWGPTPIEKTICLHPAQQHPASDSSFVQSIFSNSDDGYEDAMNNMDEIDKLRAAVVGMMVFVRSQPQMMELFNNNFESFAQIIMSPQFKPIFSAILNDISAGDEHLDNLTDSVMSNTNTNTNTNTYNDTTSSVQNQQAQTVSLTQEDLNNIGTLEALGFSKQECIQAYLLANKNIDMAASMLMDM